MTRPTGPQPAYSATPEYARAWQLAHPESVKKSQRCYYQSEKGKASRRRNSSISSRRRLKVHQKALWWYKTSHPCMGCGEADPIVLEFDHVRGHKRANVSALSTPNERPVLLRFVLSWVATQEKYFYIGGSLAWNTCVFAYATERA